MPYVQPEITCNLQWRHTTRQMAFAKQGDYNSRKVALQLYDGSNRFTWQEGVYTAEFAYKRQDGAGRAYSQINGVNAIALNPTTGIAIVLLEPEVLSVAGMVQCELRLLTEGSRIATFTFGYFVEAAVVDDSTPSPTPTPTPTPTGAKTKFFGFDSMANYESFISENPTALGEGDIVVITSTSGGNTLHTFYVLITGNSGLELDSRHVITVGSGGGSVPSGGWATSDIADGAITTAKLASSAVTSAKIGSGAVTEAKIGSGAVTSGKIGSGAVTEAKIGAGAVTNAKIGSGAVTTDKLSKLVVEITEQNGGYTPSYNFNEVRDAIVANKKVEILFHGFTGDLIFSDSSTAIFDLVDATDPAIPIKYQFTMNGLNVTAADISRYVPNPASGTAQSPSTDKDKVPTVDEYGNFVLRTPSGSSGGGAEVFDVTITTSPAASTKTAAEIFAAKQAGKIICAKIDGNDATLLAQSFNNEAVFYSIETDSGRVLMSITVSDSNNNTTVTSVSWPIGNADEPYVGTPSEPTTGNFTISAVADNTIYSVGEAASFTVGTWTNNRRFTLIFTSGSNPTSLNWTNDHEPVWPPNFDGSPVANTRYEINVENGYAVVGAWEVSS